MKKRIFLIALAVLLAVGILCLTTCDSRIPGATPGTALTAPQLRLEEDLSLAWEPVEGATEYLIYVNGSALSTTANVTWPALAAPGTYSIQVQAVKGEEKGPASQAVSYTVYGVSLPVSELFTVVGGQSVGQGQDYSFTVSYVEGCENSTPVVKINGQEATPDKDGVYSVSDVSGDLTVTIEGVALNSYTVTLPKGKGYTVKGEETALYGKDYVFELVLEEAYDRSDVTVKANGQVLKAEEGKYTVENVTADVEITVSGVEVNTYSVNLITGRGFTMDPAGEQTVEHGKTVTFTVQAKDPSYGITVKANGKVLKAKEGKYTLANIREDITVRVTVTGLPELTVVEELLLAENWKTIPQGATDESLALSPNSSLKGSYLKQLWEEGYTHLVFTVNAKEAADKNTNYTHSGDWTRYWRGFTANTDVQIRIDLNEFHDGSTWYHINFNAGKMTVSEPRAYKSPETLQWTKVGVGKPSNVYFAVEDGSYVLQTITGQGVVSPTEWLEKYCVGNEHQEQTWFVFTDYLEAGGNTRSLLWGNGEPVDRIKDGTVGGWVALNGIQTDGYQAGEVFSLHTDTAATARFKISDTVSDRRSDTANYTYTQLSSTAYKLTTAVDGHKLYLAATQELIDAGCTGLKLTVTGKLAENVKLHYGSGEASGTFTVGAAQLASGSYSTEYDVSLLGGKPFMVMADIPAGAIEDLQIAIEPLGELKPQKAYMVSWPEDGRVTAKGNAVAWEGKPYSFTLELAEGYDPAKLVVKVNGQVIPCVDGVYTVEAVTQDLAVTVENVALYTFKVHAPTGAGYTFSGAKTVQYGKDYTFTVTPDKGKNVVVEVNGQAVTGKKNSYTVTNVKEDLTVTVTCMDKGTYAVTIPSGIRYTAEPSGVQTVQEGDSLSFTVTAKDPTAKVTVKADGKELKGQNGVYTLTDISKNITVTISANTLPDELLLAENWKGEALEEHEDSLVLKGNPSLKAEYLKELWNAGFTHLVFTVKAEAAADNNTNYTHSENWTRYWSGIAVDQPAQLRIDLNEFHDGNTWHSINFNSGKLVISEPKGYQSPETLQWAKKDSTGNAATNAYFAWEDGYYVFESHGNYTVVSPTQWLKKYCVSNEGPQSWFVYTDYLTVGNNTRSIVWGWGSPVNNITDADGGWVTMSGLQADGYQDGEVFSLHMDTGGTARFKILDWVTNRDNNANSYSLEETEDHTYRFSTVLPEQKLYLASTPELIAQGYTHLKVTLTGSLEEGTVLWYGNDDWADGEIGIDAVQLANGRYIFQADLATMNGRCFTVMTSGVSQAKPIEDLLVKIEPVKQTAPVTHTVTAPAGDGFMFTGGETAQKGLSYSFTVVPENDRTAAEVQVNGKPLAGKNGVYTVVEVQEDLVITVTLTQAPPAVYKVTVPTGEGFLFQGDATATEGESYSFTVTPDNDKATVEVKVNGKTLVGTDGSYTVENVTEDLVITVKVTELGTEPDPNPPVVTDVVEQLLNIQSWNGTQVASTDSTLTVSANAGLKGDYLKSLWDAGYTHLVFTVNAESATNYTHGGDWERYWRGLNSGENTIRIDINEFHDGDTWYNLNFAAGEMTVSAPKAYKSAETLSWTKIGSGKPSNVYFAIENGYYVLETITGQGVTSPTEWLKKYVVTDDASQRSWRVYTDYITKGGNTRSLLWGWGSAVSNITDVNGGWTWLSGMQTDGYTEGEVFSLHSDMGCTARFKILDWVSNRNQWNEAQKLEYVDAQTIIWSGAADYKLRLATTQDIIQAGYNTLQVTLTGDLGNAIIWYGEDDWSDGENAVDASGFTNGVCTFEVDLTEFKANENFTMMGNAASFSDLKVHVKPVKKAAPAAYSVSLPTGEGYTATGEATVKQGESYAFTVTLEEGYTKSELLVKANDTVLTGENGTYTVSNVQGDLVITVEGVRKNTYTVTKPTGQGFQFQGEGSVEHGKTYTFTVTPDDSKATVEVKVNGKVITGESGSYSIADVKEALTVTVTVTAAPERTLVEKLLNGENWNGTGTESASSLTLSANAGLKGDYLKSLWDAGYTHLVFTVNAAAASDNNTNYTHGGTWDRYWRGITPSTNQAIRIDLNEFHDEDTWYSINFNAGEMTVSAPKAYKSKETLSWTKIGQGKPSNVYFAMENGYYVLETITGQGVTSPTEWLKKYVVTDDAGQRTWRVYTDYINKGGNTRSLLWGWGSAVNILNGNADGGWSWLSGMQTDGYTDGEVFSLHTDVGGTARFKILDWVSNRNEWNTAQKLEYVDDQTIIWSGAADYKLRLATTQDIIADGYTHLKVTMTGDLGSAIIWYGEDDWNDGEAAISADGFTNGVCTFEVDLTEFKANENFTMMGHTAAFSDIQIKVEPIVKSYSVTAPSGEDFTFQGDATAVHGQSYSFTVTPTAGLDAVVTVGGTELSGSGNRYTVDKVTSDLVITVTTKTATYTVNAPSGEGYTVSGAPKTVQHGGSYSFTVTPNEGYTVTVSVNGTVLTPGEDGKTYSVSNVTTNQSISVYAHRGAVGITLPEESVLYYLEGSKTVTLGQDYTFTVEAFDPATTLTVKANGEVLTPNGNTYTVKNVTQALTITVDAVAFTPEAVLLNPDSWSAGGTAGEGTLTVPTNSQLKADALKKLWNNGYTHLVFTVNAATASDNNTNYTHSGAWDRYWRGITPSTNQAIRIDLNEFHDNDTWYSINFNAREMTISGVTAYKSAETLKWTKIGAGKPSNVYFAMENGYYVLETITGQGVTSPTEWLEKYCVTDDASQRSWLVYTDYITKGGNTRSLLFGWGSAVSNITDVNGGWVWLGNMQTDGYAEGEVFSLHTDTSGTARFKILDWVSNRNGGNAALKLEYVDDKTVTWSGGDGYKLRLAATQDIIQAGYNTLRVTLTGDLGNAIIWYGEDDWSDGENAVDASGFTNGVCTFDVDLTTFKETENFTLMGNAAAFSDIQIKVEPMGKTETVDVKLLSGVGYSLDGAAKAELGKDYSFKLTTDSNVTLQKVTVNGEAITPVDGTYTVPAEKVTGRLIIRVNEMTVSDAIVTPDESIYGETAKRLQSELSKAGTQLTVYNSNPSNVTWENSILLGTDTQTATVGAEGYKVQGDGTNITIDGNYPRAVAYGAADLLRSLGYEFYTADVTTRPGTAKLNFSMAELSDTADFAIRSYMTGETSYNENSVNNQAFTAFSKNNNALVANYDKFGGGVELESFNGGVHNFNKFFADHTEGKYGYIVQTGVSSEPTGFAPCLTNGITYNVGGTDTTLTYAVARMKEAILANPDTYYFTFCQNDGPDWYCVCEHCTADASSHNRSGTLVNFINAMIAALEADPDLSGRDFRILTFAYGFSAEAPKGVSSISNKLYVWYAQWHNANYSINSASQDLNNYPANLNTWANLTADGNLGLWLYDADFQNYQAYFPSVNTIAANIKAAKDLGVSNILVQGAWNTANNWQAEMKAYIWSKLLWDSSLDVATLEADFLKAYFGEAAYSYAQTFVNLYNDNVGGSATVSKGYPISHGYGFYCHKDVYEQSTVHSKALDAAKSAVSAASNEAYKNRANGLLATVYGSVIGNWSGYEEWHDAIGGSDRFSDFENYFGNNVTACQTLLKDAMDTAGVTVASETVPDVEGWISFITNRFNTAN